MRPHSAVALTAPQAVPSVPVPLTRPRALLAVRSVVALVAVHLAAAVPLAVRSEVAALLAAHAQAVVRSVAVIDELKVKR